MEAIASHNQKVRTLSELQSLYLPLGEFANLLIAGIDIDWEAMERSLPTIAEAGKVINALKSVSRRIAAAAGTQFELSNEEIGQYPEALVVLGSLNNEELRDLAAAMKSQIEPYEATV